MEVFGNLGLARLATSDHIVGVAVKEHLSQRRIQTFLFARLDIWELNYDLTTPNN